MTPLRFYDTAGEPFPYTVLDDRSGIPHERGNYTMASESDSVPRLEPSVFAQVRAKAERAEASIASADYRAAFDSLIEAINLLPEPHQQWNAAGWILMALGENAIRARSYASAQGPLDDAAWSPGTIGNPWFHLRLGQVMYELQTQNRAAEELARAYMGGGREIFEGHDPKYFALVESVLRPPPGMDRLP